MDYANRSLIGSSGFWHMQVDRRALEAMANQLQSHDVLIVMEPQRQYLCKGYGLRVGQVG